VLELVRTLNRIGADSEIATTNDNGTGLLDMPLGLKTDFAQAPVWFFPRFSPCLPPVREFAYSRALSTWLKRNMDRYDLVHVHAFFSFASSTAMAIARRKKIPYLVSPHGLLCEWSLQQSALRKKLYLALIERTNLNGSAALEFTAEQELAEAAPLRLRAPGFVLPFGLDLSPAIPDARQRLRGLINTAPDEPVLLFLSRLHPKKGLHDLLTAAATLAGRRFSIVVAGSGPAVYEAQVKAQAAAGPLRGRVHFVGFVQGQTKHMLLQGADLFALTSHSESFGIAVMEALAAGLPVLVTPGVPLARMLEQFQLGWVTELNTASIAATLDRALASGHGPEAAARRERARAVVAENFTWDRIAARMMAAYQAILDGQPLPSFELSQVRLKLPGPLSDSPRCVIPNERQ
jgi:glycosyltransferase involved in cell wall biosynthesis